MCQRNKRCRRTGETSGGKLACTPFAICVPFNSCYVKANCPCYKFYKIISYTQIVSVLFLTNLFIHTHPFNGPFSVTTQVSRYQKGKTNLDFTEARDSDWQWHQLDHMQVCISLQTDSHASTTPLSFYSPDALPAAQPTASKH